MATAANAVCRTLKIIELLAGRYFEGASTGEIAQAVKTSKANASRDMAQLEKLGWARKLDNGRWSLTSKPLAITQSYHNHYNNLQARMAETTRNIMAAAR
ncbi:MAG: hypothetical protein LBQ10_01610 [Desulfovibrio sp.]|jgi:DNA-binding IclR family transcriptional regulator|nr:hypothetical protein [Desulfovibrio sp.]